MTMQADIMQALISMHESNHLQMAVDCQPELVASSLADSAPSLSCRMKMMQTMKNSLEMKMMMTRRRSWMMVGTGFVLLYLEHACKL